MATRNRTILYRKYRDALKSVRVPSLSSPSSSSGGPVIELSTSVLRIPEAKVEVHLQWVDVSEEIAANVQDVREKMGELAKALMLSFGEGKEDQSRIEALTQEITDLLKKSEKRLQ